MPVLFALTLGLGAFLLFSVEPMIAKMVLPLLGGSPAVWTTCMLFFQMTLLAGYAYAHGSVAWLGERRQRIVQAVLVVWPMAALPIASFEALEA
ncbi:spermidine synthase, partial [Singulisphaera rosea]